MLVHEKAVVARHPLQTHRVKGRAHRFPARLCHRQHILHPAILRKEQRGRRVIEHEARTLWRMGRNFVQQMLDCRAVKVHADPQPRKEGLLFGIVPGGEQCVKEIVTGEIERDIVYAIRHIDSGTGQSLSLVRLRLRMIHLKYRILRAEIRLPIGKGVQSRTEDHVLAHPGMDRCPQCILTPGGTCKRRRCDLRMDKVPQCVVIVPEGPLFVRCKEIDSGENVPADRAIFRIRHQLSCHRVPKDRIPCVCIVIRPAKRGHQGCHACLILHILAPIVLYRFCCALFSLMPAACHHHFSLSGCRYF